MKTPYDVLGVPRDASHERIRTAFRQAAKRCHPDLNAGDPKAERQIKLVIAAYEILKTPHGRAACDQYLRECRRVRIRQFGMSVAASLLSGCIVALAISLSIWESDTQAASAPPSSAQMVSTTVRPAAPQQMAAVDERGRQDVNRGSKSDRAAMPDRGPQLRQQTASTQRPAVTPPQRNAAAARERGLPASGEAMAFAARAHDSELARSELIKVIDAAAPRSPNSLKASPSSDALKKRWLEERASQFVSSQIAGRASSNTSEPDSLASAYADNVLYYGSRKSRQEILLDKQRTWERWPERVYEVQLDSITAQCSAKLCKVRGTLAWQARNGHRGTTASGISRFDYEVTPSGDGFRILSESSSDVKRSRQEDGRNHSRQTKVDRKSSKA